MIWILLLVIWAVTLVLAGRIGYRTALHKNTPKELPAGECPHVWGSWEDGAIAIIDGDTGKKVRTQDAQTKTCEFCNLKERRWVTSSNAW